MGPNRGVDDRRERPSHLACLPEASPPVQGLWNLLRGVERAQARPLIDLLVDHYDPAAGALYHTWLEQLLAEAPESAAFEVGNEENLSQSTEGYKGAPPGLADSLPQLLCFVPA